MAARSDSLPKQFREVPCVGCGNVFQSTGPNHKRCDPCRLEHTRKTKREDKRARHQRLSACSRCGASFSPDVHAHRRYCAECVPKVRNEQNKDRYAAEPLKHRQYGLTHYHKHRDEILGSRKNPEWRREAARRKRELLADDAGKRLHTNISRIVSMSLNGKKAGIKWQALVGYTLADLKQHLERQFRRGMNWSNYGSVWHVDHIVPRAAFAFETADDPDFKACWALPNLQPLPSIENISKGRKRTLLL